MKTIFFIISFITTASVSAQLKTGIYRYACNSSNTILSGDFSRLEINQDSTFNYQYRTSVGCSIWFDIKGKWSINVDTLVLIDSVQTFSGRIRAVGDRNTQESSVLSQAGNKNGSLSGLIQRRTFYRIADLSLTIEYLQQEYDQSFGMPLRQISGNFKRK